MCVCAYIFFFSNLGLASIAFVFNMEDTKRYSGWGVDSATTQLGISFTSLYFFVYGPECQLKKTLCWPTLEKCQIYPHKAKHSNCKEEFFLKITPCFWKAGLIPVIVAISMLN
jgi:hypothetical protein